MRTRLQKIVNLYVLLMFVVFPLIMVHSYYDIHMVKMYFYLFSTWGCILLVGLTAVWTAVGDKDERGRIRSSLKLQSIRKSIRPVDVFAVLFLISVVVSTFCSEWVYEAFWGNMGRYQGGYMMILFFASYCLVSRFYVLKRWHIDAMLIAGMIVCGWGVLDYFDLGPLGNLGLTAYKTQFSSTIGNIDVLTAIEAVYVAVSSLMFISEASAEKPSAGRKIFYLIASAVCFMGLECGRTANLLLSMAYLVCFMPFYAFGNVRGTLNYMILIAVYVIVMLVVALLAAAFPENAVPLDYMGELDGIANAHIKELAVLAVILILAIAVVRIIFAKTGLLEAGRERALAKPMRTIWGILGVIALCACIYVFYDANTGGHTEIYAPVRNLVIFDEKWGTNRGYVWGLALKYYKDFSPLRKLIGSGPETFVIFVSRYDLNATLRVFAQSYDSIHNEWMQRIFECGIFGFIAFYGMAALACVRGLKLSRYTAALAFAVMTYIIQSFVNISVPLVLPLVIICLSICAAVNRPDIESGS